MRTIIFCIIAFIIGLCIIWYPVVNGTGVQENLTCTYIDKRTCLIRSDNNPEVELADISHLVEESYHTNEIITYGVVTPTDKAIKGSVLLFFVLLIILSLRFFFFGTLEAIFYGFAH